MKKPDNNYLKLCRCRIAALSAVAGAIAMAAGLCLGADTSGSNAPPHLTNTPLMQQQETRNPSPRQGDTKDSRRKDRGNRNESSAPSEGSRPSQTAGTNSVARVARPDLAYFKIVSERNIFDPNRNPRRQNTNEARPKPKVVDSLALVGVITYEKGTFAFFDGSRGDFRKALKRSDSVGGLKIADVAADSVKLATGEKSYELRVGMQLRREDEGEWQPAGNAEGAFAGGGTGGGQSFTGNSNATARGTASGQPSTNSGGTADANEVLRRLMERREKE